MEERIPYTGCGSRQTPAPVLDLLAEVSEALTTDFYLRTGDARGADEAFVRGVTKSGQEGAGVVYGPCGSRDISPKARLQEKQYTSDGRLVRWLSLAHHPAPSKLTSMGEALMARNLYQLVGRRIYPRTILDLWNVDDPEKLPEDLHEAWCEAEARAIKDGLSFAEERASRSGFVLCWTPKGHHVGGTGHTLRLAQALDIPIINLGKKDSPTTLDGVLEAIDEEMQ